MEVTIQRASVEFISLVADFKLICDDANKVKWIKVIQASGSLIGSIIGGHMGDHLGRKTIFFTGQLFIVITSIMSIASRNWIAYSIIQGINCFLYGVIEVTSLTLMMEYTNNKWSYKRDHLQICSAHKDDFLYLIITRNELMVHYENNKRHSYELLVDKRSSSSIETNVTSLKDYALDSVKWPEHT
ncbi:hypothetical protein DICVIV_06440 [Dictyocaulus viviparus]|uniref:Major facilitator superfamily (MFS) profile domain-containing protein n=1 Tax=Dictyocaulus viviparus TaxID=29172 RepID=A0A0D8XS36_DICVI|nr:hypothetical protein DICVIV_06440 [Dictyocaulus viviparus]